MYGIARAALALAFCALIFAAATKTQLHAQNNGGNKATFNCDELAGGSGGIVVASRISTTPLTYPKSAERDESEAWISAI